MANPQKYGYGTDRAAIIAGKMTVAFKAGTYNKDGEAIVKMCKLLGLPHTYRSLNLFFKELV